MKSRKNPYAAKLKRQVTIRMADNLYLRDFMAQGKTPNLTWHKT